MLYSEEIINWINIVYIIFVIIWIILICYFKLYETIVGIIVSTIPFILFGIAVYNLDNLTEDIKWCEAQFYNIGLILALTLVGFISKELKCPKSSKYLIEIVFISMIFILCTLLHFWVPEKWKIVWKHVKSCMETLAVVLFIYTLFYILTCSTKI